MTLFSDIEEKCYVCFLIRYQERMLMENINALKHEIVIIGVVSELTLGLSGTSAEMWNGSLRPMEEGF